MSAPGAAASVFASVDDNADVLAFYGYLLAFSGRAEEAVAPLMRAKRLDPGRPVRVSIYLGFVYNLPGRYEDTVAELGLILINTRLIFPCSGPWPMPIAGPATCDGPDRRPPMSCNQSRISAAKPSAGSCPLKIRRWEFNLSKR